MKKRLYKLKNILKTFNGTILNMADIAKETGYTRERVRQIVKKDFPHLIKNVKYPRYKTFLCSKCKKKYRLFKKSHYDTTLCTNCSNLVIKSAWSKKFPNGCGVCGTKDKTQLKNRHRKNGMCFNCCYHNDEEFRNHFKLIQKKSFLKHRDKRIKKMKIYNKLHK